MNEFAEALCSLISRRIAKLLILLAVLMGVLGSLFTYVAFWIGVILLVNAGIAFLLGSAALFLHWRRKRNEMNSDAHMMRYDSGSPPLPKEEAMNWHDAYGKRMRSDNGIENQNDLNGRQL